MLDVVILRAAEKASINVAVRRLRNSGLMCRVQPRSVRQFQPV
jgi:hypothetical protein